MKKINHMEAYASPSCECVDMVAQEVLCASKVSATSVDDWLYDDSSLNFN